MQSDRARQFMPFAALKGYEKLLREKEKVIIPKKEFTPDKEEDLSFKFKQIKEGQMLTVVFYDGEKYCKIEGLVSKIDQTKRVLSLVKTDLKFEQIYDVYGEDILEIDEV